MMKLISLLALGLAFALNAKADFKGFVKVDSGRELFVDWATADAGKPTAVLLNGITYTTVQWEAFAKSLHEKGFGVLRFDPQGMGQTLLKYAPIVADIPIADQVEDLHSLLGTLKLAKPYNLVGLSYGGGLAFAFTGKYPQEVGKLIAMAPFTEPIAQQDQWVKSQIWLIRQSQPWNTSTDEELYGYFFHQLAYSTYPVAEPIVLENPFKLEGVYHLAMGIRLFRAESVVNSFPASNTHLIIAGNDQYIQRDVLLDFWTKIPPAARGSLAIFAGSEHKIPQAAPKFAAGYVGEILTGNKMISGGVEFDADPYAGTAKSASGLLKLEKDKVPGVIY